MIRMTTAQQRGDSNEIVRAVEELAERYGALRRMVAGQGALVRQEDTTALLHFLAGRRRLTEQIGAAAARLRETSGGSGALHERLPTGDVERVETLLGEMRVSQEAIAAVDREDTLLLEARQRHVAARLREVPASRAMLAAYGEGASRAGARSSCMDEDA